jgi:hypothetical protein
MSGILQFTSVSNSRYFSDFASSQLIQVLFSVRLLSVLGNSAMLRSHGVRVARPAELQIKPDGEEQENESNVHSSAGYLGGNVPLGWRRIGPEQPEDSRPSAVLVHRGEHHV